MQRLATDTMDDIMALPENANLVESQRWNVIHSKIKALTYAAFIKRVEDTVDVQSRLDLESIKRCIQDPLIVDYFAHNGWVNARKRRNSAKC